VCLNATLKCVTVEQGRKMIEQGEWGVVGALGGSWKGACSCSRTIIYLSCIFQLRKRIPARLTEDVLRNTGRNEKKRREWETEWDGEGIGLNG